jgi:4-diphosphocytidyl-2-C-methyl-D-erythritol kinase
MFARKTDSGWEVFAPAKLNLYLEVLGRRSDGFHELETLMAPVGLYDHLQWRPAESNGFSLRYHTATPRVWQAAAPADHRNLICRAVDLRARTAGVAPSGRFTLTKRIPVGAGLGGASSDAAAALMLASAAWGLGYRQERLSRLASQLGSDVPFFLAGQSAICRGRGELVTPAPSMPRLNVVIVAPPEGISTAEAFASLNALELGGRVESERLPSLVDSLQRGRLAEAGRRMINRLQPVATALSPWIAQIGRAFARCNCYSHLLTGSGSAYFGVMRSARHARWAAGVLSSARLGQVFTTATCR